MTTKRVTNRQAVDAIRNREDFTNSTGSLRGMGVVWARITNSTACWLPPSWREIFNNTQDIDYVVMSYETPLAWHTSSGWVVPPVKYSVTTSKHQGFVNQAVN